MKTQEQIEAVIKKYKQMLEDNKRIMDFEDDWMKLNSFLQDKDSYVASAHRYHDAELIVYACEKLIKNCEWILDIE